MISRLDEAVLDDLEALEAGDPAGMLRAVASSAAQVREAATVTREVDLARLVEDGRPRAIVVAGMGGSGISGDVLAAVAGVGAPIPIVTHRGYGLPGWVGAGDLVIAVSCSGSTEETLAATDEAIRRGAGLLGVGALGSPLAQRAEQARAPFVPVTAGDRLPRAMLWALATPLLVVARELEVLSLPDATLEATAARLETVAVACRPDSEAFVNPAKTLALELADTLPMAWGSGPVTSVVAYRLAGQLAENAKLPAISGGLPEASHNQVVAFDGPYAGRGPDLVGDLFRDRVDEPEPSPRLRLVLLREGAEEHPQVRRRADASRELAGARGVPVTELVAEGESAYERLASLVGLIDYASVYLALALGIDPTPIAPISELKDRIG